MAKRTLGLTTIMAALCAVGLAHADVLTQHNDNARTGTNPGESKLTTANVTPATFGRLWDLYADGQVVAQPLYVSQLAIDTPAIKGTFNAVVIATMHNTVYVYDADQENRLPDGKTKPLWASWLGQPRAGDKEIDMWHTNDPEWGIVSTPVIDRQKGTLWVVAWRNENGALRYRLHALDLRDGAARSPAIVIGGEPPDPKNPCKYAGGYNPCKQKQRSALLLNQGVIYVAFGGDGSKGCMFAFDAQTLAQLGFWSVTPTGNDGGIWQSGQGPAADGDGQIYLMTGNGTMDADKGGKNYGESFVKLKLDAGTRTIAALDFFAPCNKDFLNGIDMDLGSGGPVLIPNSRLMVGGGKEGVMYLVSREKLGGHIPGGKDADCNNANVVQQFQATDLHQHGAGTTYGHIHGSPVFWQAPDLGRLFVWGENDRLKAYAFRNGRFVDVDKPKQSVFQPPQGMPGGMLALSSNGTKAGSAILWAVVPLNGDANMFRGVRGNVIALDPRDVSKQLWTSELAGVRDRLGLYAKFVPPTVAGGKLFVATYGDAEALRNWNPPETPTGLAARHYIAVYGLLPPPPKPKPVVNQESDDVTVLKARATETLALSVASCKTASTGTLDCTAALETKYGAPSIHTFIVPRTYDFAGCNLLRLTTASKQGARSVTSGMGWYAADATGGSQAMTSGRFVPPGRFKQVGTGVLKADASPATLDEFIGVANCSAGQASLDRLFKPYLQFDNSEDGNVYRNWDRAQNYRISRALSQFDRSPEILQP
jgi:outer membrane protein assembly factor BamB